MVSYTPFYNRLSIFVYCFLTVISGSTGRTCSAFQFLFIVSEHCPPGDLAVPPWPFNFCLLFPVKFTQNLNGASVLLTFNFCLLFHCYLCVVVWRGYCSFNFCLLFHIKVSIAWLAIVLLSIFVYCFSSSSSLIALRKILSLSIFVYCFGHSW